ncbi:MAG: TIR domain-containing protein [Clostridia bacterium]|nr:TIR domain-containing protein [Clostridia bacterium]
MKDVFISYKSEEFAEANWVKTTLESNGISCWMAPMSIPGGSNYAVEIPKAIRSAKAFVLILSGKCQLSKWVPRELDQAINESKPIFPFMLENCPLKDDFSFYLSNVQRFAAYEDRSEAVRKLIYEIRAIVAVSEKSDDNIRDDEDESHAEDKAAAEKPVELRKTAAGHPAKKNRNKKSDSGKTSGRTGKILTCVLAAVLMMILIGVSSVIISVKNNTVIIAGEKYKKNTGTVSIKEKELSPEDLANLSAFSQLSSLQLIRCTLPDADISGLFTCPSYRLEINNCDLTDEKLSAVDFGAVGIRSLILDNNKGLSDLEAIRPVGKTLEELSFSCCSVSDIAFLQNFSEIRILRAADNGISSLTALAECVKLETIDVSGNSLLSLAGLEKCISLKKLYAQTNRIETIDGIKNATLLSDVDLSDNSIVDISLLSKSSDHLYNVYLSDNSITSIESLSEAKNLNELNISHNQIDSVAPLSGSGELIHLYAAHNQISDLTGISGCLKLVKIDLSYNHIEKTDSICLDDYASYVYLDLSHNKIKTLVLPDVKYGCLSVYANPISEWSALNDAAGSSLVFDYDDGIDFDELGNSDFISYCIFDCPLDKQISVGEILGSGKVTFTNETEYLKERTEAE